MPESFATLCGWIDSSQNAWMMAAVIESWPQPGAQRRDRAFVVATRQADRVLLERRVMDLGFR